MAYSKNGKIRTSYVSKGQSLLDREPFDGKRLTPYQEKKTPIENYTDRKETIQFFDDKQVIGYDKRWTSQIWDRVEVLENGKKKVYYVDNGNPSGPIIYKRTNKKYQVYEDIGGNLSGKGIKRVK